MKINFKSTWREKAAYFWSLTPAEQKETLDKLPPKLINYLNRAKVYYITPQHFWTLPTQERTEMLAILQQRGEQEIIRNLKANMPSRQPVSEPYEKLSPVRRFQSIQFKHGNDAALWWLKEKATSYEKSKVKEFLKVYRPDLYSQLQS